MTWSATVSGEFHEIVKTLRNLEVAGDTKAKEFGHIDIAKEMALCAVDKAPLDTKFIITISGHATSERSYSLFTNVSAMEKV